MSEPVNKQKLVEAWIAQYRDQVHILKSPTDVLPKKEDNFWAWEQLNGLCGQQPEQALEIICMILEQTDDDYVLDNLSAGPVEDLIARHGEKVMLAIEVQAKISPKFKELLLGVWRNNMSDNVWEWLNKITED